MMLGAEMQNCQTKYYKSIKRTNVGFRFNTLCFKIMADISNLKYKKN